MLSDVVIILGLSVLILVVFQRLKLPSILGFLITGVLAGPYGLSMVENVKDVETLSELGVIFLLFIIGVEFSLKTLSSIKSTILIGGLLQVGLTIGATMGISRMFAMTTRESAFMGFLLALSSTAIVLKLLQERGEVSTQQGRVTVAILIFQDIIVVPMMLITPILAGKGGDVVPAMTILGLKLVGLFIAVIIAAKYIFPRVLYRLAKAGNRELFLLAILVLCFGASYISAALGLSLALGAFFAGLIISESDYSHEAASFIMPFREIFLSFFFVSVGMLLDMDFLFTHLPLILGLALLTLVLKAAIAGFAAFVLRYPLPTVLMVGMSLLQVGEFSFILSKIGLTYELISPGNYQYFLAVSIISMAFTPFTIKYGARLAKKIHTTSSPILQNNGEKNDGEFPQLYDHLVIIGYGLNGKNVARAARTSEIPYIAIELDAPLFHKEREKEPNLILGNAEDEHVLQHLQVQTARVIVVAISDANSTKTIIRNIRFMTKSAEIIVRTRYVREIEEFLKLGADEVIPEEFETSIELFTRALKKYLVPESDIYAFAMKIREKNYGLFRAEQFRPRKTAGSIDIPNMDIMSLKVEQGNNSIVGKTVEEAGLKEKYGIRILAIKRRGEYETRILKDTRILQDDVLLLFGKPDEIIRLNKKLGL